MRLRSVLSPLLSALLLCLLLGAPWALMTQPFVTPIPSAAPAVDVARLQAHVKMLSDDLYPRSHDQFDNMERAAQYIQAQFEAAGARVLTQAVPVEGVTYRNVIARFGPDDGGQALTVVGAHYDSFGDAQEGARRARGFSRETHTPGADDNASGVAGLIELARLLGSEPGQRPIELVAYALEEPPHFRTQFMGSAVHARSLRARGRAVRLMVSLEGIGYFSEREGSQRLPLPGLSSLVDARGDFIAIVGRLTDIPAVRHAKAVMAGATTLPVLSLNAPRFLEGVEQSDHLSFWNQGYPALMVTDTTSLRDPRWHQGGDTWERLDYGRMGQVVQGVYRLTQQD